MFSLIRSNKRLQLLISASLVILVSFSCYLMTPLIGFRVTAFILLLTVSLTAVTMDIQPVLLAAFLSAFIWDFFFIPPRFTLHVDTTEDLILLIMYFVIALVNGVLTYRIRKIEAIARDREEKMTGIRLYQTFLNSLSHELKTPISSIIAASDHLASQSIQHNHPDQVALIGEISKASLRLNQQVENLLNISRIESGFLKPKNDWCDIRELVYQCISRMSEELRQQTIQVHIHEPLKLIRSDKLMIDQILDNLLQNALRYAGAEALIEIDVETNRDGLRLQVADNGPGLEDADPNEIFQKFYRGKGVTSGGTGLGLSIVRGFSEALKGRVQVVGKAAGGLTVQADIPCETVDYTA